MPDMEKVIKGLEGMIDYFFDIYRNDTDSYKCAKAQEYSDCAIDAISLLKEQKAVEPNLDLDEWECGNCGHKLEHQELLSGNMIFHEQYNYCPNCGRSVKWE